MTKEKRQQKINLIIYGTPSDSDKSIIMNDLLDSYASQEKEKEAIDFGIFLKTYMRYPTVSEYNWFNGKGEIFTTEELYELYLKEKTK